MTACFVIIPFFQRFTKSLFSFSIGKQIGSFRRSCQTGEVLCFAVFRVDRIFRSGEKLFVPEIFLAYKKQSRFVSLPRKFNETMAEGKKIQKR